jgi:MarR family transcriptional regulator for hemolysin
LSKSKVLEYDFEESIGYWVYMTSRMIEQAMNDEIAGHGITYRQFQVLAWLALEGNLSQNQLADRMRIEAPTLVGILDRMEQQEWIERQPDTRDRRKKIITPTAKVRPVWERMTACARRVRAQAAEGISVEELELVKSVLTRMQDNLRNRNLEETLT